MQTAMLFAAVLMILPMFTLAGVIPTPAYVSAPSQGGLAIVESSYSNVRRIYYQDSNTGSVTEISYSDFFDVGTKQNIAILIPTAEIMPTSPIAATYWDPGSGGWDYQVHVYFISRTQVLSEYWLNGTSGTWYGGPSCGDNCVTSRGFTVASGSTLYAVHDVNDNIAVGFVSVSQPGTITEAIFREGCWGLYPML